MGVTSSFYWPTSTEYLTFIQGYLGLWWVREENCLPDGCKESWTWVKLTVWQPFRISFALLLGKDELLWQARDWWQKMGLGILPEERGSSRTKQDPQCVCVCVCVCVHRRNSTTILTSDAFWDIDVFRVDFLPSGTRQNADTNHLFLSRECLPAQAVK